MKQRSSSSRSPSGGRSPSSRGAPAGRGPQRGGPHRGGPQRRPENDIPKSWRMVTGTHAIREAFVASDVKVLWLRQGWESSQDLRELEEQARKARLSVEVKPVGVLDKICATHQGAVIYVDGRPTLDMDGLDNFQTSMLLMLDGLEDPHNLGAIVRTSWLTGVHGILIPEDRAVGLTATVHKVACGGAEHVPVEETTNFAGPVETLKQKGYWVFGLSHKAKKSLFDLKLPEKVIWAIGAEDKGLRIPTERLCDELVSIPQLSDAASYNASVATAMALTETLRQHRHRS
ncbi:MAG: 23S rRNA (guanosine(2251)-2'-O)-methyltransferase RlmB [Bdellovibrionaceae bacterium]|nr:23S rRNA (guanosine(2251)-2'-O)-methyltransferase RlmB [Pseudobdellovibrionaceae bacterium]MBX3032444.1 23S rRNA (guanosine(2251)-2'-O)-methyltransferase RlmB [Pseudobdellovibrionaceae bacterium]